MEIKNYLKYYDLGELNSRESGVFFPETNWKEGDGLSWKIEGKLEKTIDGEKTKTVKATLYVETETGDNPDNDSAWNWFYVEEF